MKKKDESVASDVSCLVVALLFLVGFTVLALRLREVQVEESADYNYANARQSVRRVQTDGERGRILARDGSVLACNRRSLSIVCDAVAFRARTWSGTVEAIRRAIQDVEEVLGKPSTLAVKTIERHVNQSLAMPLVVWRDIDDEMLDRFCEHERELKGFRCRETVERVYPEGSFAAHLIGYVGRDRGESEAGDEKFNFYYSELKGRLGLEYYYDGFLRGVPGENRLLVDARGFSMREWTVTEAKHGPDLKTTIDVNLQKVAEAQLKGLKGACVVLNPQNGDVLAMASAPGFDPNDFVPFLSNELYEGYVNDRKNPLLNRAVGGYYAPGSTFKPVTALAGLKAGADFEDEYECTGMYECGNMKLKCSRRWGHGDLDMCVALKESCNPYFCNLGAFAGTNVLISVAKEMGLGAKTGIDFGVDASGVVPDGEWKMRTYHERWYPGDLVQMAIGQGMLLVSPLQMARLAGAIGTGYLVRPHLKADIEAERHALPFSELQLDVVRRGMRMVVDGGTGRRGGEGVAVDVSGKTGTAEVGVGANRRKNTWFIAYAPSKNPSLAVAMIVENGESGGGTTAPKVCAILKAAFGEKIDG